MSGGEDIDRFYDMLFEMSNDIRHNILLLLLQKPERMTQIAKTLGLTSPEVSRHLTRLTETKLIEKDADNFYSVTNFGEYLLNSLVDLEFITKHRDYFLRHSAVNIPIRFQKRMSEISGYRLEENFMKFLNFVTDKIRDSREYVWLYIDQYPILALDSMRSSVEHGVRYRIIETGEATESNEIFDMKYMVAFDGKPPMVEVKKHPRRDVYLFISDQGSAISFPSQKGFDYTGFVNDGVADSEWVRDLFNYYWTPASSTEVLCTLCSSPIRSESIIETINGKEYLFDTQECVLTYKRLKQIYGERFT
jgi:predicted transcriptional regulator